MVSAKNDVHKDTSIGRVIERHIENWFDDGSEQPHRVLIVLYALAGSATYFGVFGFTVSLEWRSLAVADPGFGANLDVFWVALVILAAWFTFLVT